MGRQSRDQLTQQLGSGRPRRQLVNIVDHETHVDWRQSVDCVEDPLDRFAPFSHLSEGGDQRCREVVGITIGRLT